MARMMVEGADLVIRLSRWERLGALHGSVRVPLASVVDVTATDNAWRQLRGVRAPGSGLPGVIALGTWRFRGGKDFVAVYGKPGVVVTLRESEWDRLVVSTPSPEHVREHIRYGGA